MAHEEVHKTLDRVKANFYWKGIKSTVNEFLQGCQVCQQNKWENSHPVGLLKPRHTDSDIDRHLNGFYRRELGEN